MFYCTGPTNHYGLHPNHHAAPQVPVETCMHVRMTCRDPEIKAVTIHEYFHLLDHARALPGFAKLTKFAPSTDALSRSGSVFFGVQCIAVAPSSREVQSTANGRGRARHGPPRASQAGKGATGGRLGTCKSGLRCRRGVAGGSTTLGECPARAGRRPRRGRGAVALWVQTCRL